MGRPHSASTYPPSLFRVIKVPVARHRHDNSIKPNPTIGKRLGGYHRRISHPVQKKKKSFINFVKNAMRKVKDMFKMPSTPYMRRIQELEDDIQLLRQKNEILEKGYTFATSPEGRRCDRADERSSSTSAKIVEDATWLKEGELTDGETAIIAADTDTDEGYQSTDRSAATRLPPPPPPPPPPAPPAPSLFTEHQPCPAAIIGRVPLPPPAPPIGAPVASLPATGRARSLPTSEPGVVSHPVPLTVPAPMTESSAGICLNDILSIKLKPLGPSHDLPPPNSNAFRVSAEQLFSVPLKPVSRRGRRSVRKDPDSDNDDFKILRAAMNRRIQSLYSPSLSTAASDADWSISPNLRSRQVVGRNRNRA